MIILFIEMWLYGSVLILFFFPWNFHKRLVLFKSPDNNTINNKKISLEH